MPTINDNQPQDVQAALAILRQQLDQQIPAKQLDRNLLVATWNIRAFGDLTEKWKSSASDSPKRDLQSLLSIAEIISHFDVVAIQEVKANVKALRHLLKALGRHWSLVLTDVTKGDPGNGERMAYVFDTRRVQMSGLASELVVPQEQLSAIAPDALDKQFARTPYAVSFRSGTKTFILVTLHVVYGDNAATRIPELKAIAQWLSDWAKDANAWGHNLIALGDFNIDRNDDPLYQALTSTGLGSPDVLDTVPRTIFTDPTDAGNEKFYDQIAWFSGANNVPRLTLEYRNAGYFDFVPHVLTDRGLTRAQLSWHISDHYPLWVEFGVV